MGSIVTSIGRAISGFFEKVKDFLPVLLLAAGVYLGYGYMTGFQSGGWPAIMNWGKSLISGVTQGETISAATAAADVGMVEATAAPALAGVEAMPISPTDVTTTALTAAGGEGAALAGDVAETGLNFADMTNSLIAENEALSSGWTGALENISKGILGSLDAQAAGIPRLHTPTTIPGVEVGATTTAIPEIEAGTDIAMTGTGPALETLKGPSYYSPTQMQSGNLEIPHPQEGQAFYNKFLSFFGPKASQAWGIYKNMWKDNPGMAMWTTSNVLKTILALLDDSAEKESYARRHVMGFAPGGFDDMPAKYGGKRVAGVRGGGTALASRRPSSGLKVGRLPEATASRTSAIDRQPAGIIGSIPQRTV